MKVILGKKLQMTQKFLPDGTVVPVTAIQAGPCVVTQIKTADKDGYIGVQLGFGAKNPKRVNKPQLGHLKDLPTVEVMREFRATKPEEVSELKRGDTVTVEVFAAGDVVSVTGVSKGHGFQGVVKRHGFHGQKASHGHKDQSRMPGSIGAGGVQHVLKGMRMGGHMGDAQVTVKNLKIAAVDAKKNILYITGAVPGARNGVLEIRLARS
ncbi:MAG: 50S ribosomal protein L3 [Patescibacteria group bacterium]